MEDFLRGHLSESSPSGDGAGRLQDLSVAGAIGPVMVFLEGQRRGKDNSLGRETVQSLPSL